MALAERRNRVGTKLNELCRWGDTDAKDLRTQEYIQHLIREYAPQHSIISHIHCPTSCGAHPHPPTDTAYAHLLVSLYTPIRRVNRLTLN